MGVGFDLAAAWVDMTMGTSTGSPPSGRCSDRRITPGCESFSPSQVLSGMLSAMMRVVSDEGMWGMEKDESPLPPEEMVSCTGSVHACERIEGIERWWAISRAFGAQPDSPRIRNWFPNPLCTGYRGALRRIAVDRRPIEVSATSRLLKETENPPASSC